VRFSLQRSARQTIEKVFSEFAPEQYDFQFQKTRVLVKLLHPDYVSRSEARRLLVNLEKFREIVLDFRDVRSVGQGFADEVFRVFAHRNPDIVIRSENTSPPVTAMIRHAGGRDSGSTSNRQR
jgi:hypothetical protein